MKVLVVAPAPRYSTFDVYEGHVAGFRANGCETFAFDYGKWVGWFEDFARWARRRRGASKEMLQKIQLKASESIYVSAHAHEVDLVWTVAPVHIHPVILGLLRRDGIPTAGYMTECPYEDENWTKLAPIFRYCFLNDRFSVDRFRELNPQSYYLGHAYNPERHHPNGHTELDHDVSFVGSGFPRRRRFFADVDWSGIDLHIYGFWKHLGKSPLIPYLTPCIVDNEQTANIYRRTRVGLQLHRADKWYRCRAVSKDPAESLGPRSYELAGCQTFQISDWRLELSEIFGTTVPTFKTPSEMEGLIRYYLSHESERKELAEAQHDAVREHTFENRINQALEFIA